MSFSGKVAIITGGAQGIGACLCTEFLKQGAGVVCADTHLFSGQQLKKDLCGQGQIHFIHMDVSDEASVKQMIDETLIQFGRIDVLVNNAAIACTQQVTDLSFADWSRVLHTNLSGPFLCSKYGYPSLRATKGVIVNLSSTRALMSEPDTEAYSASKAGLVGLTHALAMSLGPEVRVNCISPGWIDTGHEPILETDHQQHPVGRVGRPQDIADLVLFLCSDRSTFITGQNFIVDGGMTRKMLYL